MHQIITLDTILNMMDSMVFCTLRVGNNEPIKITDMAVAVTLD